MRPIPGKITGFRSRIINALIDCIEDRTPLPSATISHEWTPSGTRSHVKATQYTSETYPRLWDLLNLTATSFDIRGMFYGSGDQLVQWASGWGDWNDGDFTTQSDQDPNYRFSTPTITSNAYQFIFLRADVTAWGGTCQVTLSHHSDWWSIPAPGGTVVSEVKPLWQIPWVATSGGVAAHINEAGIMDLRDSPHFWIGRNWGGGDIGGLYVNGGVVTDIAPVP